MPDLSLSIEAFLRTFELEEQQPQPPKQGPIRVRVVFEKANWQFPYTVHCFEYDPGNLPIPEELNRIDLEGRLERIGQFTFLAPDIRAFSQFAEQLLDQMQIRYHRNPPLPPLAGHPMVSYGLVAKMDDTNGSRVYSLVRALFHDAFEATNGDLSGWSLT